MRRGQESADSVCLLSAPAQWFPGQRPGCHFSHAPIQLLHLTVRNLKPREVMGLAQGHPEIWWPHWDHDPGLWTPARASEKAEETLQTVTSLVPLLIPAARQAGSEDLQLE